MRKTGKAERGTGRGEARWANGGWCWLLNGYTLPAPVSVPDVMRRACCAAFATCRAHSETWHRGAPALRHVFYGCISARLSPFLSDGTGESGRLLFLLLLVVSEAQLVGEQGCACHSGRLNGAVKPASLFCFLCPPHADFL